MNGYPKFPKIPRLRRNCVITEKIDGTNALVHIDNAHNPTVEGPLISVVDVDDMRLTVRAGSRTRWITPGSDNFGFAQWVSDNLDELVKLGTGSHYGEWWGRGIQRAYGLDERRFSLFNTKRWNNPGRPDCCDVVPILFEGVFDSDAVEDALTALRVQGSVAAPGFNDPEGVVVYHAAANTLAKVLLKNDELPKELVAA